MSGRCGVMGCGKGKSEGLDRATEYRRIIESFDVLSVPADIQTLIREALDSDKWDWFEDCDGCTGVSDVYWPTIYFPPCLRHDFDWGTGNGGWGIECAVLPDPVCLWDGAVSGWRAVPGRDDLVVHLVQVAGVREPARN